MAASVGTKHVQFPYVWDAASAASAYSGMVRLALYAARKYDPLLARR